MNLTPDDVAFFLTEDVSSHNGVHLNEALYGHTVKDGTTPFDQFLVVLGNRFDIDFDLNDPNFQKLFVELVGPVPSTGAEWDKLLRMSAQSKYLKNALTERLKEQGIDISDNVEQKSGNFKYRIHNARTGNIIEAYDIGERRIGPKARAYGVLQPDPNLLYVALDPPGNYASWNCGAKYRNPWVLGTQGRKTISKHNIIITMNKRNVVKIEKVPT